MAPAGRLVASERGRCRLRVAATLQQPAELATVPVPVGGILERSGRPDLLRREAGDAQRGALTTAGLGGGAFPARDDNAGG